MTVYEAHGVLASLEPDTWPELPCLVLVEGVPSWPLTACALASVSGMMQEAVTVSDLGEALQHGIALLNADIISPDAVQKEAEDVLCDLMIALAQENAAARDGG